MLLANPSHLLPTHTHLLTKKASHYCCSLLLDLSELSVRAQQVAREGELASSLSVSTGYHWHDTVGLGSSGIGGGDGENRLNYPHAASNSIWAIATLDVSDAMVIIALSQACCIVLAIKTRKVGKENRDNYLDVVYLECCTLNESIVRSLRDNHEQG